MRYAVQGFIGLPLVFLVGCTNADQLDDTVSHDSEVSTQDTEVDADIDDTDVEDTDVVPEHTGWTPNLVQVLTQFAFQTSAESNQDFATGVRADLGDVVAFENEDAWHAPRIWFVFTRNDGPVQDYCSLVLRHDSEDPLHLTVSQGSNGLHYGISLTTDVASSELDCFGDALLGTSHPLINEFETTGYTVGIGPESDTMLSYLNAVVSEDARLAYFGAGVQGADDYNDNDGYGYAFGLSEASASDGESIEDGSIQEGFATDAPISAVYYAIGGIINLDD